MSFRFICDSSRIDIILNGHYSHFLEILGKPEGIWIAPINIRSGGDPRKNGKGNHWTLFIVDFAKKTTLYFDPLTSKSRYSQVLHDEFLTIMCRIMQKLERTFDGAGWRDNSSHVPRILQEDGYNCGVFVVYYAERILNSQRLDVIENMDHRRGIMKTQLLQAATEDTCFYCDSTANDNINSECVKCKRYCCIKCSSSKYFKYIPEFKECEICKTFS